MIVLLTTEHYTGTVRNGLPAWPLKPVSGGLIQRCLPIGAGIGKEYRVPALTLGGTICSLYVNETSWSSVVDNRSGCTWGSGRKLLSCRQAITKGEREKP